MTKGKVLVTGTSIRSELLDPLRAAGLEVENPQETLSDAALAAALADCVAWIKGGAEAASAAAMEAAPKLEVIAFSGMGYESSVDVAAAKRLGVAVTITHDTLNDAMADVTLGLVLASVRRIHANAVRVERGVAADMEKRRDLASLQFGILGMGGSGTRIAEVLREGFRAPVNYFSRTRKLDLESRVGIGYSALDALLGESDVLIVIVAGNDGTWGLLNRARMALAKQGQILVNVARPAIVDADALLWGLAEGPLSYAAYDGFYKEPADVVAKLMSLAPEKLMVTPHIGSLTHDARDAMGRSAVESVLKTLRGEENPNRVV